MKVLLAGNGVIGDAKRATTVRDDRQATPENQSSSNKIDPWSKVWCILTTKSEASTSSTQMMSGRGQNGSNSSIPSKPRKILLVDREPDRQARISVLKQHGFSVYPALAMEQASTRCRPGAYDLIILNADPDYDMALQLYKQIHERDPQQHVLVMSSREPYISRGNHVSSMPERLLERVESLLGTVSGNPEPLAA